jgi:hypothetical protein
MLRRSWSLLGAALLVMAIAAPAWARTESDSKCGSGVEALSNESFSRTSDGKKITATFTVNAACNDLQVTLAIHEHSRGEGDDDKLADFETKNLNGSGTPQTLTADARNCDVTAYLVTGPADEDVVTYATEQRQDATELLTVGTACSEATGATTANSNGRSETLPFTGSRTTTTMLVGLWLLVCGALVAWTTRYRGARVTRR